MPQTIVTPDQDSLVTEIHISAPPERVFKAISDEQEQRIWWDKKDGSSRNWDMDARRGGKWRFSSTQTAKNINGVTQFECTGEILEFDPPRVLAYTWIANWHSDKSRKTVVRWELTSKDGSTLVKVTHSGLAEENVARKDYQGGWPGVVVRLKTYIEK